MLNVDEALRKLDGLITPVTDSENLPLAASRGRVLSAPIAAPIDLPPFDCSAMDGYAIRASDVDAPGTTRLKVIDESLAGHPSTSSVADGQTVRIFTGAAMPAGADAVVIQEDVERSGDTITFSESVDPGANVRVTGHDVEQGHRLADTGDSLDPYRRAWLAASGVTSVEVVRKIRVAVFSTGDELADPGNPLAHGQIYDSNRVALMDLMQDKPVDVIDLGRLPDDPAPIRDAIEGASRDADLIVTSGGVSVGDADFVKPVVESIGSLDFWKLALKPGKPLAIGRVRQAVFLGLPGNPVSTIVTYLLFVAPAIDRFSGAAVRQPLSVPATLASAIRHSPGRREYQRGTLERKAERMIVTPTGDQSSNRLATFARANCLIVVPEDAGDLSVDETVEVILLPDERSHVLRELV